MDDYYRDLSHLSYEERWAQNFDDPGMLESELLIDQLHRLANG